RHTAADIAGCDLVPALIDPAGDALGHRRQPPALRAEVIYDRLQTDVSHAGDLAEADVVVPALEVEALGGPGDPLPGPVLGDRPLPEPGSRRTIHSSAV